MDENGIIGAFMGNDLPSTDSTPVSSSSVPSSQPDFDTVGSGADAKGVLDAGAAAVTKIAGAVAAINQARASSTFNNAIAANNQALAQQQLGNNSRIATLAGQTQLAQAQAAYNKAAGIVQNNPVMVILAVATLVVGAIALMRRRR